MESFPLRAIDSVFPFCSAARREVRVRRTRCCDSPQHAVSGLSTGSRYRKGAHGWRHPWPLFGVGIRCTYSRGGYRKQKDTPPMPRMATEVPCCGVLFVPAIQHHSTAPRSRLRGAVCMRVLPRTVFSIWTNFVRPWRCHGIGLNFLGFRP